MRVSKSHRFILLMFSNVKESKERINQATETSHRSAPAQLKFTSQLRKDARQTHLIEKTMEKRQTSKAVRFKMIG